MDALDRQKDELLRRLRVLSPGDTVVRELLEGWVRKARKAVGAETAALLATV